ncbi:MAG: porin [Sutterella wadsworthensis]|nr:porin [Sutterella wadsworthensis]
MFKKSLAAVAVLGAFAGSALAADVQLYGRVDMGVSYFDQTLSATGEKDVEKHGFSLDDGNSTGSRFGLKGTEDLGNGLKVGFVLENGFKSDTGVMKDSGRLFDREATLSIAGDFGTFYAGRMGSLISDAGSVGFYAGTVSPFGSGWSKISGHTGLFADYTGRYNNAVAYVSPDFAGLKVYAQYAMGDKNDNKSTNERYGALGAKYVAGPLEVATVFDYTNKASSFKTLRADFEDTYTFNLGGSYDFGFLKTFVATQYFKNASDVANVVDTAIDAMGFDLTADQKDVLNFVRNGICADGWGLNLGVTAPVFGGTVLASTGYMDGEAKFKVDGEESADHLDLNAYAFSVGYQYPLSKRTSVYAGAGYTKQQIKEPGWKGENEVYQVMSGLVHKF